MTNLSKILSALLFIAFIGGCSGKGDGELFNLSPETWYSKILEDINNANMEDAEKHYTSFSSEHIASPLLEEMTLIMAWAFVEDENYEKANKYLDEYIRLYGTTQKIEYARFLKIRANFDSFSRPNRNQKLMLNSIDEIRKFIAEYPQSEYRPLLETMLTKLRLAEHQLNIDIKDLYQRTDRESSAKIYEQRIEESPLNGTDVIKPRSPWYRAIFE
ncbi:outer membrane protein assembly factor BamD [uncultured Campylobacter sp.]|uniref:outer membrane protein assembly factor BamD n=1 Tax=uncultured Campylobacter sp. TaxID=218934 RepID=UPI002628576F|nr:outer membrane protein assembly factor BamD [uncultured Campylobacter sp.]